MQQTEHALTDAQPKAPKDGSAFNFALPMHVFEKASAPEGKKRRFGGICSTDSTDRQGERILQDGLDWGDFFEHGWFNDNHSQKTADVLGYGDKDSLVQFKAGDLLPNGTLATNNGTWVEGYLLDRPACDQIWDLAQSLQGTGRNLGFSVEGNIVRRTGPANKTIAKAKIRNIAVTNCPVNTQAKLEILARSLLAVEQQVQDEEAAKAMGGAGPDVPLNDAQGTGPTAGRIVATECLEPEIINNAGPEKLRSKKKRKKAVRKSLSCGEALDYVRRRVPGLSYETADLIVEMSRDLSKAGKGEGSRGGKIIGHTKSGKPIYGLGHAKLKNLSLNHTDDGHGEKADQANREEIKFLHPGYTAEDHGDAAEAHGLAARSSERSAEHAIIARAHDGAATDISQAKKSLTPLQALSYLQARTPGLSRSTAEQIMLLSKSGEGSRGGRIIGHTRSGKAVYALAADHKNAHQAFSHDDHLDAAKAHMNEMKNSESFSSQEAMSHHAAAKEHLIAAEDSSARRYGKSMTKAQARSYLRARAPDLSKSTAEEIMKMSKAGEGSRGGHIIGHTKSGKAVYEKGPVQPGTHADYTAADHEEAAQQHFALSDKFHEEKRAAIDAGKKLPGEKSRTKAAHHFSQGAAHREASKRMSGLGKSQAISYLQARAPGLSKADARVLLAHSKALQTAGLV